MSKIITTFDQVEIPEDKTTLVLCDIDDTILRYPLSFRDFYKKEIDIINFMFMWVRSKAEKKYIWKNIFTTNIWHINTKQTQFIQILMGSII